MKWQLCLDSLKQLSSAAYRVSCLLRATTGNAIMDHEFHAGGAVLHRANIISSSQIKLRTDISLSESARVRHIFRVCTENVTSAACTAKAQNDAQMTERTRKPRVPGHNTIISFARVKSVQELNIRACNVKKETL